MPNKNNYVKTELSSDSAEMGKIIFTVQPSAFRTNLNTQRFENKYIAIKKQ